MPLFLSHPTLGHYKSLEALRSTFRSGFPDASEHRSCYPLLDTCLKVMEMVITYKSGFGSLTWRRWASFSLMKPRWRASFSAKLGIRLASQNMASMKGMILVITPVIMNALRKKKILSIHDCFISLPKSIGLLDLRVGLIPLSTEKTRQK